jgi:hypothetical protein
MQGKRFYLLALVATLALAGTALAQGPNVPQHSDPNWRAAYWNNTTLSGSPALERSDAKLDFDWGTGSPGAGLPVDGFSARWNRYLDLAAGTYRFTSTSDDGMRVYVDGKLLIDQWYDHPPQTVSADASLSGGHHLVTVEYYENSGIAVARLSWTPVNVVQNWRGQYFANKSLSGSPALIRDDARIDFRWGSGSPAPDLIPADRWSARWTRTLRLKAGMYRFVLTVDDGARLWVNGHRLIDTWKDQPPRTYTADIYLSGSAVPVKMEYYENTGSATAQLTWHLLDGQPAETIVDDLDAGFVKGGAPSGWRTASEGYGGHLTWTQNNDAVRPNYNWARWYPKLTAGRYEVLVYIPDRYTTTGQARYWISHADGFTLRVVDQSANGGRWVSLGTYHFRGTQDDYLSLADVTFEPYLSRLIGFDAAKWQRR